MTFHDRKKVHVITLEKAAGEWFFKQLKSLQIIDGQQNTFAALKTDFETTLENFELFWFSKPIQTVKEIGLLTL